MCNPTKIPSLLCVCTYITYHDSSHKHTLSLWGVPLVRRVVVKGSCLTLGSYSDHKVFDLRTLSPPRRKSQVGAILRLRVPGFACGRVRIAGKKKIVSGG